MGLIINKISNHHKVKESTLKFFSLTAILLSAVISTHAFIQGFYDSGVFNLIAFAVFVGNFFYYLKKDNFKISVHILISAVLLTHSFLFVFDYVPAFSLFLYFTFPAISVVLAGNKYGTIYSLFPLGLSLFPLFFNTPEHIFSTDTGLLISYIFSYIAILLVTNFTELLRKKWHESYMDKMHEKNQYIMQIMEENKQMNAKSKQINKLYSGVSNIQAETEALSQSIESKQETSASVQSFKKMQKENFDLQQTIEIISDQQEKINEITKGLRDSLNYARSIQDALLPQKETLEEVLGDYFILYYPKEVVSGDFYYVDRVNEYIVAAVADCTGHGVPGGFLTMLGTTFIHQIVNDAKVLSTGEALNRLREQIKQIFSHFGSKNSDGLDIALIAINTNTNEIQYSGAFNPLVVINKGSFTEYKPVRNPIGFYPMEEPFTTKLIPLKENDMIYMFSDGFADQPGGSEHKRFSNRNFKELLYQIHESSPDKQETMLETVYNNWRGNFEQIDDVTVMGIKWKNKK